MNTYANRLGIYLKQKQQMCEEPIQSEPPRQEQVFSHTLDSSSEDEPLRVTRQDPRIQASATDFKIEIPEFEGKLDPEDFLDWLHDEPLFYTIFSSYLTHFLPRFLVLSC